MTSIRVSLAIAGWCLSYFWIFAIAGPDMTTCTQASDDAFVLGLIFDDPILLLGLGLVAQGYPWSRKLRWGALPHLLTFFAAAVIIPPHFASAVVRGRHLCDIKVLPDSYGVPPAWWHPWYWPIQIILLSGLAAFLIWYSMRGASNAA